MDNRRSPTQARIIHTRTGLLDLDILPMAMVVVAVVVVMMVVVVVAVVMMLLLSAWISSLSTAAN